MFFLWVFLVETKTTNEQNLLSYLKGSNGSRLEPEIGLEVLGDLPDETLEGQLTDQELGGLLVTPDLTEGDCSGPVPVGLLDSAGGGGRLTGGLGGQLLTGSFSSGGFTSGLLGTGHGDGLGVVVGLVLGYLIWKEEE